MLNICMTADHELFSGINVLDEESVMVKPTKRLLDLLESHGIPLTLFTDVCSIERYRQVIPNDPFPELVEAQLRYAVKRGHDVQLHIHPHWYDSFVQEGKWRLKTRRFRLHDWGFDADDSNSAQAIILRGKQYLDALLKPVEPNYRCIGFRAGGWCLQPEQQVLEALLNVGIWIDTTVFKGGYNPNPDRGFDFRRAPDLDSWWVNPAEGLLVPADGGQDRVFEITIGSSGRAALNVFPKSLYKLDRRLNKRHSIVSQGSCIDELPAHKESIAYRIKDKIKKPIVLCYDNTCARAMLDIVGKYVRQDRKQSDDSYVSVIGHPKVLQEDDFMELDRFCVNIKRKFEGAVRFVTIRDIERLLTHKRDCI